MEIKDQWFRILILIIFIVVYAIHWLNVIEINDRIDKLGCNALCPDDMILTCERPLNSSWGISNYDNFSSMGES
jgi:hypothetical protein